MHSGEHNASYWLASLVIAELFDHREMLVSVAAMYGELGVAGLLDDSGLHELRHQLGGCLGGVRVDLELIHLGLQLGEMGEFGLCLHLFELGLLLVFANLLHGTAPLAADLEHVRRHALRY